MSIEGYHPRATAMVLGFGPVIRRASIVGIIAGIGAGIGAGLVLPRDVPGVVAIAVLLLVPPLAGTAVAVLLVPSAVRRAYEAFSWLGRRETLRFREATASSIPIGAEAVRDWLAANPFTPVTGEARVELLVAVGQFGQARAEFARLPVPKTDLGRLNRASLRTWGELVETGEVDLVAFDEVAATLPAGSDLALEAEVVRALAVTRMALLRDTPDPMRPLREVRPRLGREATLAVLRDTWLPFARQLAVVGLLLVVIGTVTGFLGMGG
jgi:hypothetical protein